jgi:5'-nucleotidase
MDGTIAHFDREFDRHLEARYAHLPDIPRSGNQLSFNLWDGRTLEEQEAIREIMNHPGFYRHLEPMEGAVDAVHEMTALGHEVHFLSAPWTTFLTCAQDKYDWIGQHFGDEWRNQLFLAKDKTLVHGDILFDDKTPIPKIERASWTQVFIHQPYNQNASGLRIHSWDPDEWKATLSVVEERIRMKRIQQLNAPFNLYEDIEEYKFA